VKASWSAIIYPTGAACYGIGVPYDYMLASVNYLTVARTQNSELRVVELRTTLPRFESERRSLLMGKKSDIETWHGVWSKDYLWILRGSRFLDDYLV
jgi:hypothetical protein